MSGTPRDLFPDLYPSAQPKLTKSTPSIADSTVSKSESKPSPEKRLWCVTQWTTLSFQAKNLGLATLPFFDPKTMILSKEVNVKLWKQIEKLYDYLGPEKAPYATPSMIEGGEVEWHSYLGDDKGQKADSYRNSIEAWW